VAPHLCFDASQAAIGRSCQTGAPHLLPQAIQVSAQRVTLPLGHATEQQTEAAATGAADVLLDLVQLALQAGATGTRADLTKLARFMLKLPTDAGIGLSIANRKDDGCKGSDGGGKRGELLHVLRSLLLKPP
jgi:hypothetical protein